MSGPRSPRPSTQVEVNLSYGSPEYQTTITGLFGFDPDVMAWWEDLGDLLGGRPGWHCDLGGGGLTWGFGPVGAMLFVISMPEPTEPPDGDDDVLDVDLDGYPLYDHETDEMHTFADVTALGEWLDANESRHRAYTRRLSPLAEVNDWAAITGAPFVCRIDVTDEGTFIGTVPQVPMEFIAAATFSEVIAGAKDLIADVFGAPESARDRIKISAHLSPEATAILTI